MAAVSLAPARTEVLVESNGRPGVALAIFTKEGHSVSLVGKDVGLKADELSRDLPPGAGMVKVFDQAESIGKIFGELWTELFIGMGMVFLICVLGLNWRTAIMVALSIPVSAAVGFGPLSWLGIDLHQVTIGALII